MNKINKGNVATKLGRLMKMDLLVVTLLVTMMFAAMLPGTALTVRDEFANTNFAAAAPFTYNHATGGGAYNEFLISLIKNKSKNNIIIPDNLIINFKEALIFAFLGVLRLRKEINCLSSVTGADIDNCGGVVWEIN